MKAVGYYKSLPVDDPACLQDIEVPAPEPRARDLLVRVSAISVNPVDTKVRRNAAPEAGQAKVLGYDAVGTIEAVGHEVRGFRPGDRVYYSGSITRPGCNSELHCVDERIAAIAPRSLTDAEAAALPLTTITAYELLFDRLSVPRHGGEGQSLLVIGGAGGVGSILIQLARRLTSLKVIATASRPESREWCFALGAHAVIDHAHPLAEQLLRGGHGEVDMVASLTETQKHYAGIIEALRPQGKLGVIDDAPVLDAMALKTKCLSLHWEMMFARARFETPDMHRQGELLAEVAAMVDEGDIRTTLQGEFGRINAENLRRAHALIESGKSRGKIVLQGF